MRSPTVAPRFGTDGLRGEAGRPPLDPITLRRVGAALGVWLQRSGPAAKRVVVGNDGRASAGWILDALASGLAGAEVVPVDAGLLTTPALAYLTRSSPFAAGVMISASHNAASDNGVKVFDRSGAKLPDAAEREIERLALEVEPSETRRARVRAAPDLIDRYIGFLANSFPALDLSGTRLVVDAAHGGGARLAPDVLRRFGAEVVAIGCAPDGTNINAGVGALHPEPMATAVRAHRALLGIALDGDGDRGIFADGSGQVRDGDDVMAALGPHLHASGELPGATVVATVMSNLGLRKTLARHGIAVHATPVGDRAVVLAMREHRFGFGGEQSGHIIFARETDYTGDGLFTALKLLSLPGIRERGGSAAFTGFHRFPQVLLNVRVPRKPDLATLPEVQAAVERVGGELGADGRVVLRYSGTEDLCRVMVEGPTDDAVRRNAEQIADAVRRSIV